MFFLALHVFLKELFAPWIIKQDMLTCEMFSLIFFDIRVELIGSELLCCKQQRVCQNLERRFCIWEGLWHSSVSFHLSQLPFLSQTSGQVFFFLLSNSRVLNMQFSLLSAAKMGSYINADLLIASNDLWEKVACLFLNWRKFVFTQWYRIIRTDRHGHILGLWSPTKVKRLHCMRFALLNSLKDKRHARTLSPPPSLSLFILQPVAFTEGSYLTRKLHCSRLSIVRLKLHLVWSSIVSSCIVSKNCPFVCGHVLFPNQWKVYVGRSFESLILLYIGIRFVSDNWCKNRDYTCISII